MASKKATKKLKKGNKLEANKPLTTLAFRKAGGDPGVSGKQF